MYPNYSSLNEQAEASVNQLQKQIDDKIANIPELKDPLIKDGYLYNIGSEIARYVSKKAAEPVCEKAGDTVGIGVGARIGYLVPGQYKLAATFVGALLGKSATQETCEISARAMGKTIWSNAQKARSDAQITAVQTQLSEQYMQIRSQELAQLLKDKSPLEQDYLREQFNRHVQQLPFYELLSEAKKDEIRIERTAHAAGLSEKNTEYKTFQKLNEQTEKQWVDTADRMAAIIAKPSTSGVPTGKVIAENKQFLKEQGCADKHLTNEQHHKLNAVLQEQKRSHFEMKKIHERLDIQDARYAEQIKREERINEYRGMEMGFNVVQQIGIQTNNKTLAKIGSIGASSVSIAFNAAALSGAIPGLSFSGCGLMIPYAGIALAGISILSTVFGRKKEDKATKAMLEAISSLSSQMEDFRKEVHQHLELISKDMHDSFAKLDTLLFIMHGITKMVLTDGFETVSYKLDSLQADLNRLSSSVTKGLEANYLQDFVKAISAIEQYCGMSQKRDKDIEEHLVSLTTWLTQAAFIKNTNGNWMLPATLNNTNALSMMHLRDHQKLLQGDTSLCLGYFAGLAANLPVMAFPKVSLETIPNISLYTQGVEAYVRGRLHLGAAAKVIDPEQKRLKQIKSTVENAISWLHLLKLQERALFTALITAYENQYRQFTNEYINAARNRLQAGAVIGFEPNERDSISATIVWPSTIDGNSSAAAVAKISAQAEFKIPRLIQKAVQLGIGTLTAHYIGTTIPASRGYNDTMGDWTAQHWKITRGGNITIEISYEYGQQKHVLFSLPASIAQQRVGDTCFRSKGGGGHINQGNQYDSDSNAANAMPQATFFTNSWAALVYGTPNQNTAAVANPLVNTLVNEIVNKCVIAHLQHPQERLAIHNAIQKQPELLQDEHVALDIIRDIMLKYVALLNTPALAAIRSLWDKTQLLQQIISYRELAAVIDHAKTAIRTLSPTSGNLNHPILNQLRYGIHLLEYLETHEQLSIANESAVLVEELQVDASIIYDPARIDSTQLTNENKLGAGSFGQVYKSVDRQNNQYVAIKLLFPGAKLNEQARGELVVNAHLANAQESSQYVVNLLGVTRLVERDALVMEYVDNGTLEYHLHEKQPGLPWDNSIQICREMIKGLAFLHSHQITHGDFKSANVLLTSTYQVKIADYGLSTVSSSTQRASTKQRGSEVHAGTFVYRAPELIKNEKLKPNQESDIYALGVVLWEIVTRQKPFCETDGSDAAILTFWYKLFQNIAVDEHFVMTEPNSDELQSRRDLYRFFSPVIVNCRATEPANRPKIAELV
ncbi:MAG: protein kinase [Legionella sp.]|jgi:hypothetical protein